MKLLLNSCPDGGVTVIGLKVTSCVNVVTRPHLNSPYFPNRMEEKIREASKEFTRKIYALDDQSAIKIVDGQFKIITEGQYLEFN